ncbi:hypothetical protein ACJ72_06487 [Emergomyces africanus]|uniref:Uncharacterized protein n=1 Tax=Emergomyces africanus TaxID=1955775 RepID=A0A1B7NQY3_9EURO|nr:hypothetical protein ACJ72_06487 [Emergomyces africanus]
MVVHSTQPDPSDLKKVCANEDVQREIVKLCPENMLQDALKSFSKSCSGAGQKVSIIDTNKPKPTGTSPGGSSGGDGEGNGSGSGSGQPTSTGAGSSPSGHSAGYAYKVDSSIVAAVVALVGLVSTL